MHVSELRIHDIKNLLQKSQRIRCVTRQESILPDA